MLTPLPLAVKPAWKRVLLTHIVLMALVTVAMAASLPQAEFVG